VPAESNGHRSKVRKDFAPAEIAIDANAILRDVDVLVAEGTPLLPAPAVHDLRKRSPVGL
jgi:hypothetical protein